MANPELLVSLLVPCWLIGCSLWVLHDARVHAAAGRPPAVYLGNFQIETPETWAVACFVMWIFFFPLYLKARTES